MNYPISIIYVRSLTCFYTYTRSNEHLTDNIETSWNKHSLKILNLIFEVNNFPMSIFLSTPHPQTTYAEVHTYIYMDIFYKSDNMWSVRIFSVQELLASYKFIFGHVFFTLLFIYLFIYLNCKWVFNRWQWY
jgi:uncharacterized paraquat-inducible protein A